MSPSFYPSPASSTVQITDFTGSLTSSVGSIIGGMYIIVIIKYMTMMYLFTMLFADQIYINLFRFIPIKRYLVLILVLQCIKKYFMISFI